VFISFLASIIVTFQVYNINRADFLRLGVCGLL